MKSANGKPVPSLAECAKVGMRVRSVVAAARKLRRSATDVERKFWHRIRGKQIEGFRFRRQRPMGKYIVDFICLDAKMIVELDGGQHAENIADDAMRTAWLESLGYRVLRFWNNEVIENMDGVLQRLREDLLRSRANPTPALPLAGEGAYCGIAAADALAPSPAERGVGMGVRAPQKHGKDGEKEPTT